MRAAVQQNSSHSSHFTGRMPPRITTSKLALLVRKTPETPWRGDKLALLVKIIWQHANRLETGSSPRPFRSFRCLSSARKLKGCIISLYMENKLLLCLFLPGLLAAQTYDLLIKTNQIDGISD